jgi:hypothetical protein
VTRSEPRPQTGKSYRHGEQKDSRQLLYGGVIGASGVSGDDDQPTQSNTCARDRTLAAACRAFSSSSAFFFFFAAAASSAAA